MTQRSIQGRVLRGVLFAGLVASSATLVTSAFAGSCPADKVKANAREPVALAAKGVTDTTLAAIDLGKQMVGAKDHELRFRKLTIEPGGIVPWHSHDDRPAII